MAGTLIPRPEHPRPQFVRPDWINLNGQWTFAFDPEENGTDRGFAGSSGFDRTIMVPFCPESELSGVGHKDFIECMWYHRTLSIPQQWAGKRVLLHFGAVDWECEAFIDGASVGVHRGGSVSFSFDITSRAEPGGSYDLVLRVVDRTRSGLQGIGKQSQRPESHGCHYTRVTGIWQTVWMEAVGESFIGRVAFGCDIDTGMITMTPWLNGGAVSARIELSMIAPEGNEVYSGVQPAESGTPVRWQISDPSLWSPESPSLYTVRLALRGADGETVDRVETCTAFRHCGIEDGHLMLNGRSLHLRFVLDQGYYPDGIWTAPSDDALRRDIELSMEAGFNGARLHQKVFEERFHYWADRLGYLTWGEYPSWGMDMGNPAARSAFAAEWREIILRDMNHPSIIAWTPFNETRGQGERAGWEVHKQFMQETCEQTHALDPARPVHDTSGHVHVKTDIYSIHEYSQDPSGLAGILNADDGPRRMDSEIEAPWEGQPYILAEFGGTKWIPEAQRSDEKQDDWGYGDAPKSMEEALDRMQGLVEVAEGCTILDGWCWTQLTDVEQERNGLYTYRREPKFPADRLRAIFGADGIEEESAG